MGEGENYLLGCGNISNNEDRELMSIQIHGMRLQDQDYWIVFLDVFVMNTMHPCYHIDHTFTLLSPKHHWVKPSMVFKSKLKRRKPFGQLSLAFFQARSVFEIAVPFFFNNWSQPQFQCFTDYTRSFGICSTKHVTYRNRYSQNAFQFQPDFHLTLTSILS